MTLTRLHWAFLLVVTTGACSGLTEPTSVSVTPPANPEANPAATATATAPAQPPVPAPAPAAQNAQVSASHILIAYKGAMRADASIERSKDQARARAQQILARARKGEDFAKLADETSDDPSAKRNHGALGRFTREQMVKPFADAAFAMKPGEISDLVETPFGFHVIKRTE